MFRALFLSPSEFFTHDVRHPGHGVARGFRIQESQARPSREDILDCHRVLAARVPHLGLHIGVAFGERDAKTGIALPRRSSQSQYIPSSSAVGLCQVVRDLRSHSTVLYQLNAQRRLPPVAAQEADRGC